MAFVDTSKGEWRCQCPTPGDPSAYDLSAHGADDRFCERCHDIGPLLAHDLFGPHTRAVCAVCNPDPSSARHAMFQPVCPDCQAKIELPTQEEFEKALEQGERDRAAVASMEGTGWADTGMRFR